MSKETALSMLATFSFDPDDVIMTSAKNKIGIIDVINAIIDRLPSPVVSSLSPDGFFHGRIGIYIFISQLLTFCIIYIEIKSLLLYNVLGNSFFILKLLSLHHLMFDNSLKINNNFSQHNGDN